MHFLYTCSELNRLVVSEQACLRCTGLAMKYDNINLSCVPIDSEIGQCENLNKQACLSFSKSFKCQWLKFESSKCNQKKYEVGCKMISDIKATDKYDCSSLNYEACNQVQQNLCWFNLESKLCQKYNPLIGDCDSYKNESTCKLSMVESCKWNGEKCQKFESQYCNELNKFGCLKIQEPCVWSDNLLKCESAKYSTPTSSCNQFLVNQQDVSHMNAKTCIIKYSFLQYTQINGDKSCIFGKNYKCREILEPQLYECETQELNKNACLLKTKNSCAFIDNKCISMSNVHEGCKNYLNQVACLNQIQLCYYDQKGCQKIITQYGYDQNITSEYCKLQDSISNFQKSFIYSSDRRICIDITDRNANVPNCGSIGINKYACLSKTLGSCKYINSECQKIQNDQITQCDDTLNWVACLSNKNLNCKFLNYKCQPILENDSCLSLQIEKAIINSTTCTTTTDYPCKYDSILSLIQFSLITSLCITHKLVLWSQIKMKCARHKDQMKKPVFFIHQTQNANLNQRNVKWIMKKQNVLTRSMKINVQVYKINIVILMKKMDAKIQILISSIHPNNCSYSFLLHFHCTCSLATNTPCFYDQSKKICSAVGNSTISWENHISFNKLTCLMIKDTKTYWLDGCQQATDEMLTQLKCDDFLNQESCLNVKTKSQFCQYRNGKCETYSQGLGTDCNAIVGINNGIICSLNTSKACKFDQKKFKCQEVENTDPLECNLKAEQFQNKLACQMNESCIFIDKCQQCDKNNLYDCQQVSQIQNCINVLLEGCYRNQQQQCSLITSELSKSINCSQIENKVGCIQLQTKGQYCRFYNNKCQNENILDYQNKKCTDIILINNYEFCEQTKDIACIYDPLNSSCIQAKQEEQDLTCPRGLNKLACIPQNSNSNQCQFFNYCYGQNTDILNCDVNDMQCCQKAKTIESCLFQTKFKCQWNNGCTYYNQLSNQISCNSIVNSSRNVCYSLINQFCIFDSINLKCKEIVPLTCDQVQSKEQCIIKILIKSNYNRIPKIPCYWNQDECQNKEKSLSDSCQSIKDMYGNFMACIQVQRSGQMCAFINYSCQSFIEIQNSNNCLDYINQNACLLQTISQCYWDQNQKFGLTIMNDNNSLINNCKPFEKQNSSKCEQNLSYLSCLNITTNNTYCQWKNHQCEQITIDIKNKLGLNSISQVNINVCSLITDYIPIMYDINYKMCKIITDFNQLTCYPQLIGINMYGCISIKNQICIWNQKTLTCQAIANPNTKKQLANQEQISQTTCSILGRTPISCSLLEYQLPCGGVELGCDYVDLEQVQCNHIGLNKYACMNIKTQSCIIEFINFKQKYKKQNDLTIFGQKIIIILLSIVKRRYQKGIAKIKMVIQVLMLFYSQGEKDRTVCSMVQENDPCSYDSSNEKCKKPNENLTNCDVEGINVYGCVQIKNCYFKNNTCKLFDPHLNLSCKDVQFANELVCSQIKNGECKHNLFGFGCIQTQILDTCSTSGININGCNSIEQCQWKDEKCQCKMLLEQQKECSEYLDYQNCNNTDRCYFEQSMFKENEGICKQKYCDHNFYCNYELYRGKICYKNFYGKCIEATSCNEIKSTSIDCSEYSFNNIQCVSDGKNGCIQFETCDNLDRIQCIKQSRNCIMHNSCIKKECYHIQDQYSCIQFDCTWVNKKCISKIQCFDIQQEKDCNKNYYQGFQCSWNRVTIDNSVSQFCTSDGCSYLQQNINCQGTQIGTAVCLQTKETICLSCEQITEICDCMEKVGYCKYDTQKNQCISQPCESFNELNCPQDRCFFSQNHKICIPQCRFQYSKSQCQLLNVCAWDDYLTPPCIEMLQSDIQIYDLEVEHNIEFSVTLLIPYYLLIWF